MKVLVATDGSEVATEAVEFVRSLAETTPIDAILVTVSYDPVNYAYQAWYAEWTEKENKRCEAVLQHARELLDQTCKTVKTVHGTGVTVQFILAQAEAAEVDLLVIGAKGHSAIGRMLLGSVSDDVATRAECSVVVVRPGKANDNRNGKPIQRIVMGYDKSIASREAAAELMQWNLGSDANIDVVSYVERPLIMVGEGYMVEPPMIPPESIEPVRETAERMASQIAEQYHHTDSHTSVVDHIGEAIVQAAEKGDSDLICVGNTGHGFLGEIFLGSTSKYVLRHAPCSVWISRHHFKTDGGMQLTLDGDATHNIVRS